MADATNDGIEATGLARGGRSVAEALADVDESQPIRANSRSPRLQPRRSQTLPEEVQLSLLDSAPPTPVVKADPIQSILEMMRQQQEQQTQLLAQTQQHNNAMLLMVQQALQGNAGSTASIPAPAAPATAAPASKSQPFPNDLSKIIHKRCKVFQEDVLGSMRVDKTLAKAKSDLQFLISSGTNEYPPGMRGFKSPVSFTELGEDLQLCSEADWTCSVTFPRGCKRREALAVLHKFKEKIAKQIDVEALEHKSSNKRRLANISRLEEITRDVVEAAQKEDEAQKLGLPKPLKLTIDAATIKARVQSMYDKIYSEINAKITMEIEQAEKQKEKDKKDEPPATPPEHLLSSAIKEHVREALQDNGISNDGDDTAVPMDESAGTSLTKFVSSIQKNGSSPSEVAGQNTLVHSATAPSATVPPRSRKGNGKEKGGKAKGGKGKGKGKTEGARKGKGKDGGPKGKGKGKGKAKGKTPPSTGKGNYRSGKDWWGGMQKHAEKQWLKNVWPTRDAWLAQQGGGKNGGK